MTLTLALAELETLTFTGLVSNRGATNVPPKEADLPALLTEDISHPFSEGLEAWNVAADVSTVMMFFDHLLLISGPNQGTVEERWTSLNLYTERYLVAITADLTMNDELEEPLKIIIIRRGEVQFRHSFYHGVRFRHLWKLRY